ncbi:hypothetical protein N7494_010462 [Penicillium frequentans]|uniref:Rhodopsin domain-containing protein n=1 Tax=Penicillium frequentans TaxID=3151616 RepID=A0AAD6CHR6_9EURO|nr:hypothetical protein N7494_010462 [Penicillium glabrum]
MTLLCYEQLLFAEEIAYIWMQFAVKAESALLPLAHKSDNLHPWCLCDNGAQCSHLHSSLAALLSPMHAFWSSAANPDAKCLSTSVTYYIPVTLSILVEFAILIFPVRPLWKFQASIARRLCIIVTVTISGIAVMTFCLPIIILHELTANSDFT